MKNNLNKVVDLDVLIINPRMMMLGSTSIVSQGPITIASFAAAKGLAVRVIDNNSGYRSYSNDELCELAGKLRPKLVGISVNLLNAFNAYELILSLRKYFPDIVIMGGGLHSYCNAMEMLEHGFDFVFKGEAEIALERFINCRQIVGSRMFFQCKWKRIVSARPMKLK